MNAPVIAGSWRRRNGYGVPMVDDPHHVTSAMDDVSKDGDTAPSDRQHLARRYQLGAVAEASATLELALRFVFSALLGSPRASVVAAGQSARWLVDNSLAMIKATDEVRAPSLGDEAQVQRLIDALQESGRVYAERSQFIHGAWVEGGAATLMQVRSRWRKPHPFSVAIDDEEMKDVAARLDRAYEELMLATMNVDGLIVGGPRDA